MAGILNNKERMIDFIMTKQGRRQMADGRMRIEFATVTDMHTFYQESGSFGVAEPAGSRLFFEASERPQDMVVPELVAGTNIEPFRAGNFEISGKSIASGTFVLGSGIQQTTELTGSEIIEKAEKMLLNMARDFQDLRITATEDFFSDKSGFILGAHTASFALSDMTFMNLEKETDTGFIVEHWQPNLTVDLRNSPSIFSDPRFSHLPNYKYLPPINIPVPGFDPETREPLPGTVLGDYPQLGQNEEFGIKQLKTLLNKKQKIVLEYDDTSRDNNLLGQFYEFSEAGIEKLSVIDYGLFTSQGQLVKNLDPEEVITDTEQYFFVGKIVKDKDGVDTFLNLFTVVFTYSPEGQVIDQ